MDCVGIGRRTIVRGRVDFGLDGGRERARHRADAGRRRHVLLDRCFDDAGHDRVAGTWRRIERYDGTDASQAQEASSPPSSCRDGCQPTGCIGVEAVRRDSDGSDENQGGCRPTTTAVFFKFLESTGANLSRRERFVKSLPFCLTVLIGCSGLLDELDERLRSDGEQADHPKKRKTVHDKRAQA